MMFTVPVAVALFLERAHAAVCCLRVLRWRSARSVSAVIVGDGERRGVIVGYCSATEREMIEM